ncbi:SpoIIE family protein phosphatase [Streptomyces sp. NPDC045431]|uniref:ATP-binding SpoIIE family protein phosphatase n=1 Tax=Streptomyces sp. NPDC045431 TaxID=3155613 RepID=UPI0033F2AB2A
MGTDVDALLHRLARKLRPRADQLAEVLVRRLRGELPGLWDHEDLAARLLEEIGGHTTAFLDVLDSGLDTSAVPPPPQALEVARESARRGLPLGTLLRAYRLGHLLLLQRLRAETARLTDDPKLVDETAMRLISAAFAYVDRGSEQVVAAYQAERERRLRRRLALTDAANRRIGTTLDIARTAQELAEVGTEDFADLVVVDLLDSVVHEPPARQQPTPGPALRRIARRDVRAAPDRPAAEEAAKRAAKRATEGAAEGAAHRYPEGSEPARALNTGQPVLHRVTGTRAPAWWAPAADGGTAGDSPGSVLLLPLQARGGTLGLVHFYRDRAAVPFDDDDLLLAQEIGARAAVSIDNARRYTHERLTALTLQRNLLPQHTVEHPAVETASRYLPSGSGAGVGGDWYDVIPLSGARVALVVGDVVGRGLQAAATMGRLRMAVRAFADIDLMPDELLTHLDDVVIRLQREEAREDGELSARCLYAVYDAATRMCSLASAGHVMPAVATPPEPGGGGVTRSVRFPELPIGPPLGLGGLPFETAQFELPEGSLLTLYTDGLIESRTRDLDTAYATLGEVLAGATESPDETCDRLLDALLPSRTTDDATLLVVRTRALDPGHIAVLDIPPDPAAVAGARSFASGRLAAWKLEDLSFTTELMVSELVTNAIRYGRSPVQLRLILQSTLTCEVFDAGSTSPRLRRARTFDEGGRGLLLVAQLAERWGTRHTREGKVIWAEQPLPVPPAS